MKAIYQSINQTKPSQEARNTESAFKTFPKKDGKPLDLVKNQMTQRLTASI